MRDAPKLPPRARALVVAALVAAVSAAVPRSARAADPREDSRAAFLRGVGEAHKNHFTAARDAFLEAYRLFPHPSILLNLGVAEMHTGEYVLAEASLTRFLVDDGGATADDLANARATLAVVRKHIGTLRIRAAADGAPVRATLDTLPLALSEGAYVDVRAVVGPATLRVEADGHAPVVQQVVVAHDDNPPLDVVLPRSALVHAGGEGGAGGRTLAWGLLGGAAAAVVVGTVAGIEAITLAHDYNSASSPEFQSASTRSEGVAWRTTSDVAFATALVAGGAGIYFFVRPLGGARAQAEVGPRYCGVKLRF